MRVRLAGKTAGEREARLERLAGATVADFLRLAAEALGVPAAAGAALRLGARELRGEDTLAEAGVGAGCVEELRVVVGLSGGMPTVEGAQRGGVLGALDALQAQVSGLVSVLDLAVQQERAPAAPVFHVTTEVMLLTACHAPVSSALPVTNVS